MRAARAAGGMAPMYVHASIDDAMKRMSRRGCAYGHLADQWAPQDHAGQVSGFQAKVAAASNDGVTTLMVRNVPRHASLRNLVEAMDRSGFAGHFDFVYLPRKDGTSKNFGYAFVNFHSTRMAVGFMKEWHKTKPFGAQGGSLLDVTAAKVQGFHDNVAEWCQAVVKSGRSPDANSMPLILREMSADAMATLASAASSSMPPGCPVVAGSSRASGPPPTSQLI